MVPLSLQAVGLRFTAAARAAGLERRVIAHSGRMGLASELTNLLAYEQTAGDLEESTVRAQIAIWLAQGHAPEEIRERFPFTAADLDEAHRIIAGTF